MALRHPFQRGDVVQVQFPFSDASGAKVRPAVVLSTIAFHDDWNEVLLVAATSRPPRTLRPSDCALQDWKQAGLSQPSWVRCHIATAHHALMRQRLGQLSVRDLANVEQCLRTALGL